MAGARYADAMATADRIYADVVAELRAAGFADAAVTQTGGMCLAIEVPIGDRHALLTDYDDVLPWERENLTGWTACVYETAKVDDEGYTEEHDEVYCAEGTAAAPLIAALVAYRDGRAS